MAAPDRTLAESERLIRALSDPRTGPWHTSGPVVCHETHIAWVLLAGDFAWKIRKPVDLGFLDYATLERRLFCAREEIRLNRRLAPDLYLDVAPITGTLDQPVIDGNGEPLEYAVRMRRFAEEARLDVALSRGAVTVHHFETLAQTLGNFHESATRAPPDTPHRFPRDLLDNFDAIAHHAPGHAATHGFATLRARCEETLARADAALAARLTGGFVRECHGDLHCENVALIDDVLVPFDGIEFNPALYRIDVLCDLAFLTMDLARRGRSDFAWRLLDGWLARTGDYAGVPLLGLYETYRALVRAKVAAIRGSQTRASQDSERLAEHLDFARERLAARASPRLILMHGVSGTGKSTLAARLGERLDAIRVRSDVERFRLFGRPESVDAPDSGIYTPGHHRAVYARLAELARALLASGQTVIVDAAFLRRAERAEFIALAHALNLPVRILELTGTVDLLAGRIEQRLAQGHDPSQATVDVLRRQQEWREPPAPDEGAELSRVDAARIPDVDELLRVLRGGR